MSDISKGLDSETNCKHEKKWKILSDSRIILCIECAIIQWNDNNLITIFDKRQKLSLFETSLKYGPHFIQSFNCNQLTEKQKLSLMLTINELVFNTDYHISRSASNCFISLIKQIKNQSIIKLIIENIFKFISSNIQINYPLNDCILDLLSNTISITSITFELLLRKDFPLIEKLRTDYLNCSSFALKLSIIKLFIEFYKSNEFKTHLLDLDQDFHLQTIQIIYQTIDPKNGLNFNNELVIKAIDLLSELSSIDSIIDEILFNENLPNYLNYLLNFDNEKVKILTLEWICDALEIQISNRMFANTLRDEIMIKLFDSLYLSLNAELSNHLLNTINLIFLNTSIRKPNDTPDQSLFVDAINKSLELSIRCENDKFFMNALTAFTQLLDKNPKIRIIKEFSFFKTLDLLEDSISKYNLFENVVQFSSQFINVFQTPDLIPTKKLREFLSKVIDSVQYNICLTNITKDMNMSRLSAAINLMTSYLNLFDALRDRELNAEENELQFYLFNNHKERSFNDNSSQSQESVNVCNDTEVSELLSLILKNLENIFISFIKHLFKENPDELREMFFNLCSSLLTIFKNGLYSVEDLNPFLQRMISSGNILYLMHWFNSLDQQFTEINKILSSLLSNFVIKIQSLDHKNCLHQELSQSLNVEDLEQGFDLLNDKEFWNQLMNSSIEIETNDNLSKFYDAFIAINYYSFKFICISNFVFDEQYIYKLNLIINCYFKSHLSVENHLTATVRRALFLASFITLDERSFSSLRYFFFNREEKQFLSQFYTNHIVFLKWLFTELKCDNFSDFALNKFIESIPDENTIDSNENIIQFMELINSNDKVFEILFNSMCNPNKNRSTLNVMQTLLNSEQQFIAEDFIYNIWSNFANKVFLRLPEIISNIINNMNIENEQNLSEINKNAINFEEQNISKLIKILFQMIANESIENNIFSNVDIFLKFPKTLCNFIKEDLNQSTIESIFEFFKIFFYVKKIYKEEDEEEEEKEVENLVLTSNRKALTENILKSTIPIVLMIGFANNDCTKIELKELSVFLLLALYKTKSEFGIKYNLMFNLDIKSLINWINSGSKVMTESAVSLLKLSFNAKQYFNRESVEYNNVLDKEKIENLSKLLISLQNAVFKTYISIKEFIVIWNTIFNDLPDISTELYNHLTNNPWFRIIIQTKIDSFEFYYFDKHFMDFLTLIYSQSTINRALIEITNRIVKDLTESVVEYKNRFKIVLETINHSIYKTILNTSNRKALNELLNEWQD